MGLDYTAGCVNLRDVGEVLELLADRPVIPRARLLRGGKIDFVRAHEDLLWPATIINLRKGPTRWSGASMQRTFTSRSRTTSKNTRRSNAKCDGG